MRKLVLIDVGQIGYRCGPHGVVFLALDHDAEGRPCFTGADLECAHALFHEHQRAGAATPGLAAAR